MTQKIRGIIILLGIGIMLSAITIIIIPNFIIAVPVFFIGWSILYLSVATIEDGDEENE
jgi:hypothetical protein